MSYFGKPHPLKKVFIVYGPADTGKSSFVELLEELFGKQGVVRVSDRVWLNSPNQSNHRSELASL